MLIGFKNKKQVAIKPTIAKGCSFTHSLATGPTGSGKTVSFISSAIKTRIAEGHSIFCFDEKGTLHLTLKALAHDEGISLKDIYQFGTPEGVSINLIDGYNEKKMNELAKTLIPHSKDPFWGNAAHQMLTKMFFAIKAVKDLWIGIKNETDILTYDDTAYIATKKGEQVFSFRKTNEEAKWHQLDIEITAKPLVFNDVALVFNDPKQFIMYCEGGMELLGRMMRKIDDENRTVKIALLLETAQSAVKKLSTYQIKYDLSEASGNSGVYFSVAASIKSLMDPILNDPYGKNLNTLLEEGSHLVLSCESFTPEVTSIVMTSVLSRFLPRAKMRKKRPVSMIIDEAYRVLSSGTSDLYTDILREAHVDVVMATQNEAQMIERLGEIRWLSFQENFLKRISYGSNTKKLEPFEYQHHNSNEIYKAEPVFIDQQRLMEIELRYQQANALYVACRKTPDEVVIFDRALFDDKNQVIVYDLKTQDESVRDYAFSLVKDFINDIPFDERDFVL